MPSELGQLIRATRAKQEIGLREFARRIDKSPAFVTQLECDEDVPSVAEETLRRIADELGLSPNNVGVRLHRARRALKQKLEHRQTELTTLAKQRDTLKTDIEGLEAAVTELTQIVTAYEQAAKNLEKEKRELDIYVETKTPMLEVAVGEKKETIERIIYDADCEIQEAGDRVEALERDANEADGAAEAARAQEAEEKAAYTALKDSYKQIEQKLKGLKQLRDTIEKDYDDKNKVAGMYFLMKELGAELETIVILSKSELERELYAAWNRLKRAKNQLRDAIARQDAAQEELARARKVFETLTTNRRRTILERIDQYCGDQAS